MANSLLPTSSPPDAKTLPSTLSLSLHLSVRNLDVEVAEVEDIEEDGGMLDGGRCDDCVQLQASSSPSAAGVPHTPSANSNSASTALPLLLPALPPSSSSSSMSSNPRLVLQVTRPDMCLPGDAPHLEELDEDQNLDLDSDIGDEDRIIGQIQDFLDENDDILRSKDREQRTASSGPSTTATKPLILARSACFHRTQEEQRLHELERIADADPVAVVDPFTPKKSLETVVGHIRRFVQDLGSAPTLSLPPTARHARNSALSGAHAFGLKSQSGGKDAARFTRLIETTLGSGILHGFWSSRRRRMAAVVQGKGKGKAGRRIHPRAKDNANVELDTFLYVGLLRGRWSSERSGTILDIA
ncbi:hypothetical protein EDB89DRAFT_2067998 [Lactarius sanguifluus]|nr:hypothetical protein EDB89DRAFT_2067998 [Lactarius sanguifluus]